jgi:exodeoxyribonuclease V beta subunit
MAWEDIHQFPRGRFTGTCWHTLLELLDFSCTTPDYRSVQVSHALVKGGFAPAWNPAVTRMVDILLDTPRPEANGLRLSQLQAANVLRELEFHLGGGRLDPKQLTQLLADLGYPELAVRGDVTADWGVVHGFIDLIVNHAGRFYLGDYKSNWLGPDASAYASALLLPTLRSEGYTLQALIYTLALHRYLRLRIADYAYERHYGGMWFFFLRGLSATDPTQGVVLLRPDLRVIEALDAYFSPG